LFVIIWYRLLVTAQVYNRRPPVSRSHALIVAMAFGVSSALLAQTGAPQRGGGAFGAAIPAGGALPRLDLIRLPAGFSISIYADHVPGARSMALGSDGTVFVGTRANIVHAVVDRNHDYKADEVLTVASGLTSPNGVAFKDGALYVAEINRVSRYDGVLDFVRVAGGAGPAPKQTILNDKLPSDRMHGWKYLSFGPDGLLYFQVGAPGNILERPDPYASILRMRPDGTGLETFARGVRNSVGMAWHPDTKELWFTDNGRDLLGDEQPNDELNHAARPGMHFGYPYCHEGAILDPEFGAGKSCADYTPPVQRLGPHVAALGLKFYTGAMFPAEYRKQLLIVNHGSWNRSAQVSHTGYRLMVAKLQGDKVVSYEPFAEGWLQKAGDSDLARQAWGQPVDLLELPDGSLLVSDDRAGAIYRISYSGKK
jgi:glucose/arabinose dehydrogenase